MLSNYVQKYERASNIVPRDTRKRWEEGVNIHKMDEMQEVVVRNVERSKI